MEEKERDLPIAKLGAKYFWASVAILAASFGSCYGCFITVRPLSIWFGGFSIVFSIIGMILFIISLIAMAFYEGKIRDGAEGIHKFMSQ